MQKRVAKIERPKQLLVEGRDEELFFQGFLRNLRIVDVQAQGYGGKPNFGNFLEDLVDSVDFDKVESIGIVRDADDSAASALQSVQDRLSSVGLPVPQTYLVPSENSPTTSVFIMPDNSGNGALEKLCLTVLANDPAITCVEDFLKCVNENVTAQPQPQDKARIHAFLSSRKDPELRLGEAAQRGYIPWDNPAFDRLSQFLRSL